MSLGNVSRRDAIFLAGGAVVAMAGAAVASGADKALFASREVPVVGTSDVAGYVASAWAACGHLAGTLGAVGTSGVREPESCGSIHAKVLLVEGDAQSIDAAWDADSEAQIACQVSAWLPVWSVDDGVCACVIDPGHVFGLDTCRLVDATFARDNDHAQMVEGCEYDKDTGVVWVPRDAFDGAEDGLQVQLMLCCDDVCEVTADTAYDVWYGDTCIFTGKATSHVFDGEVTFALPQEVGTCAKDGVCASVDGDDGLFVCDGVSVRLDVGKRTFTLPIEPLFSGMVHIYVKREGASLREAFAIESAAMNTYQYGWLEYTPDLVVGKRFSYTGAFLYPDNYATQISGQNSPYRPLYEAEHSMTYAWFDAGPVGSLRDFYISSPMGATWDDIKRHVYEGPFAGDSFMVRGDLDGDGLSEKIQYYGQLLQLPGAPGTSGFTMGDFAWWSTLAESDPVGNDAFGAGVVPAFCEHTSSDANSAGNWNQWLTVPIDGKVMAVEPPRGSQEGYVILALNSTKTARGADISQGAGVILKVPLRQTKGYLVVEKVLDK